MQRPFAIAGLLALLAMMASPARAQAQDQTDAPAPTAEEMLAKARELYRAPGTRRPCKAPHGNEIVVCAADPSQFRTESSLDEAVRRGERPAGDIPDAPDVDGLPKGGTVVVRGCFIPPCPPPPAYFIDFSTLPEPLTPEEAAKVKAAPTEAP
ncbi:conserved hypothetical protein [Altererythrobacter sp. B11]|uniref:hypothetical protein n=1 Tax=Altererythrobacter sp. B11 TaxID=2060312 RepID=UPI000DC6DEC5|nr:hypothetical protein [Altererythrobacter sp. B11]BBC71563.1 conserved hypothetical protein [Altererythrobacter sp. B11]